MLKFICPVCQDCGLQLRRKEENVTRLYADRDDDFDYGKEEVVDCDMSVVECSNGHVLMLKDETEVQDYADYLKWLKENK